METLLEATQSLNLDSTELGSNEFNPDDTEFTNDSLTPKLDDLDQNSLPVFQDEEFTMDLEVKESASEPKSLIPTKEIDETYSNPKTLNDITEFAQNASYGDFQGEANPPYSLIIKDLKYYEDIDSIAEVIYDLKLSKDSDLNALKASLQRGQLLLPRLSEYVAIIIAHKLRKFDIEILMGLTEEISPPKSYESNDKGYTSKKTLYNNKSYHKKFSNNEDIITTSLPQLSEYKIVEHLGLISHIITLSDDELSKSSLLEDQILSREDFSHKEKIESLRLERENNLAAQSEYVKIDQLMEKSSTGTNSQDLDNLYKLAIDELKNKALKLKANSVLGINFQVLPINIEQYMKHGPKYQIMATGNLAWIEKI